MPANFQRFLPLLLIVFLLLFVLPTIFKHHSSKGLTSKELSQETIAATTKVDALQREFRTAHKGYTGSVADLLALDHSLGKALGDGVVSRSTSPPTSRPTTRRWRAASSSSPARERATR